ncbi:MAG: hypothetical protein H0W54_03550 [Rubrobacter sp.]|nr:hypothetical protein [Rubrobacter sp.]
MELVSQGASNREIAGKFWISEFYDADVTRSTRGVRGRGL